MCLDSRMTDYQPRPRMSTMRELEEESISWEFFEDNLAGSNTAEVPTIP